MHWIACTHLHPKLCYTVWHLEPWWLTKTGSRYFHFILERRKGGLQTTDPAPFDGALPGISALTEEDYKNRSIFLI